MARMGSDDLGGFYPDSMGDGLDGHVSWIQQGGKASPNKNSPTAMSLAAGTLFKNNSSAGMHGGMNLKAATL